MEIKSNVHVKGFESNIGIDRNRNEERVKTPEKTQQTKTSNMEFTTNIEKTLSEEDIIGVIEKANKDFIVYDRKFEFSIHEKTKQIMIKVIDATNDEVIRELPPEKVLDMVAAMWEVAGIIVDRKI